MTMKRAWSCLCCIVSRVWCVLQDLARVVDVLRQEALAKDATTREHASGAQDRAEDAATEAEVEAAAGVSGEVETAVVHDVAHVSACSSSTLATILEVDQEYSTDTDTPPAPLRVDESSDSGKEQKPELSGENEEVAAQSNTKSDDSTMPEKNTVIEHQQQEAPKAGSLQIELVLDMEMSEIEGSEKTFELAVLRLWTNHQKIATCNTSFFVYLACLAGTDVCLHWRAGTSH